MSEYDEVLEEFEFYVQLLKETFNELEDEGAFPERAMGFFMNQVTKRMELMHECIRLSNIRKATISENK